MSAPGAPAAPPAAPASPSTLRALSRSRSTLLARGEPLLWLTGGGLALCLFMIVGLLALVLAQGLTTFWPERITRVTLHDGRVLAGEVNRVERYAPRDAEIDALPEAQRAAAREGTRDGSERRMLRTGNYEFTNEHFAWISDFQIAKEDAPEWAVLFERLSWGRFYGEPVAFLIDGKEAATTPAEAWKLFQERHGEARDRWERRRRLEEHDIGAVNRELEDARLALRSAQLKNRDVAGAERAYAAAKEHGEREFARLRDEIAALNRENDRYRLRAATADGQTKELALADIVRAYPANQLGFFGRVAVYVARWFEFLFDEPREANSEGGVFPAIFGTFVMTVVMSLAVVPFGVLAALYLREYAKAGLVISSVRIAINNLAGVPSIVFGVFGLGFFCYIVGGRIDEALFEARLPNPTYGKGGLVWASLTLALLTLPVVIVATEEALAAIPGSMREGSYACGASKWQTIRRIILPRAMPGIMTGMILAIARGAGEVAPLMLVGAVKFAPELPFDTAFPFLHPERSFMHLGYHIYDLGFQSQNSEAAKPMVYTTTLLLIGLIAALNLAAIWLRTKLRRRFAMSQF